MKQPVFVLCEDGKFYEGLEYLDFPERRAWFLVFDPDEPAEIVVRKRDYDGGNFGPVEILRRRGFGKCLAGVFNGRQSAHTRFFGTEMDPVTRIERPADGHECLSWFVAFRRGVPLPTPKRYDECVESYAVMPGRAGVFFGVRG